MAADARTPAAVRAARRRALRPWLLLTPTLAVLAVLLLWPLARVVLLSFQDYGLREMTTGETDWTGLDNYADLLTDRRLWETALPNTVVFAAVCVALTVTLGTLVALLFQRLGARGRLLCSTAVMTAWAMPAVTGTYVWVWIFDPLDGLVSGGLDALGLIEPRETNWFTDRWSFYAIAALNVTHHGFPFVALTVYAGLLTIPRELPEAATMDGAGPWQRFRHVTFPSLRPVFAVVTVLSVIWDVKVFTQVYLMPGGDGANPEVWNLGVWSYLRSFGDNAYGSGAAVAVLLTLLLLGITALYVRVLGREGREGEER